MSRVNTDSSGFKASPAKDELRWLNAGNPRSAAAILSHKTVQRAGAPYLMPELRSPLCWCALSRHAAAIHLHDAYCGFFRCLQKSCVIKEKEEEGSIDYVGGTFYVPCCVCHCPSQRYLPPCALWPRLLPPDPSLLFSNHPSNNLFIALSLLCIPPV